jgi:hypothetical protein
MTIDHMYHFTSMQREKHYLRLFLMIVQNVWSFDDLYTINRILHFTYCFICTALHLLEDDDEWINYFIEIVHFSISSSLQSLFMIILMHNDLADSYILWKKFCIDLCNDLSHCMHESSFKSIDFKNLHLDYELYLIAKMLQQHNKILTNFNLSASILN